MLSKLCRTGKKRKRVPEGAGQKPGSNAYKIVTVVIGFFCDFNKYILKYFFILVDDWCGCVWFIGSVEDVG